MPDPSPANSLLSLLASVLEVTGLACLILLAALATAGTATWLWRLAHHPPSPPGHGSHPGQQPR